MRKTRHRRSRSLRLAAVPRPGPVGRAVRVLGLDPGSRVTGYGLIEVSGRSTCYLASGSIRVGDGELAGRLRHIYTHVAGLVAEHLPGGVAIERGFILSNTDSELKLGQAAYAALGAAAGGGAAVYEYAPREVKLAVTGTGAADKGQVQHMVKALLGIEGRVGADAADALAIALCHAQHRGLALVVGSK